MRNRQRAAELPSLGGLQVSQVPADLLPEPCRPGTLRELPIELFDPSFLDCDVRSRLPVFTAICPCLR